MSLGGSFDLANNEGPGGGGAGVVAEGIRGGEGGEGRETERLC